MKKTTSFFQSLRAAALAAFAMLLGAPCLSAQVTLDTIIVADATCASNGSIVVVASGDSGSYSYQLFDTCQTTLPQNSPLFNNLEPCDYTVVVTDGQTGETASQTVTVGGNYASPELSLICQGCAISAIVENGLPPYQFWISTTGVNGPWQPNTLPDDNLFQNLLPGATYWVKVTDACGDEAIVQCTTGGSAAITDFSAYVFADGNLHIYNVNGGGPSYLYTLQSSAGTFTNNTGIFPPDQWGCNMNATVSDGCTELTKAVKIYPYIDDICVNFADGAAEMTVHNVVSPFTVTCGTPSGAYFTSNTGVFTGLPTNVAYYYFTVTDACGNWGGYWYRYLKSAAFAQTPSACNTDALPLIALQGHCEPGVASSDLPAHITCLSCDTAQTGQISNLSDTLIFTGHLPGDWEIALVDDCGDHFTCRDSVLLRLEPMCDSLRATLVDRFFCDNGTISDRPLQTDGALFILKNKAVMAVDSNATGLFTGLAPGIYTVSLNVPGCGFFQNSVSLGTEQSINPYITTYIHNSVIGGHCTPYFNLWIFASEGPYILTGGPNDIYEVLDEEDMDSNCRWYWAGGLLPGDYELSSITRCGVKIINLPAPEFNLQITADANCPGDGLIIATGSRSYSDWNSWSTSYGLNIPWYNYWSSDYKDPYSLDVASSPNSSQKGSPYTFVNVAPGQHTVYLYTFNSSCPVDTAIVVVPPTVPLGIDLSNGILCDGQASTDLTLNISGGKAPYTVQEVDADSCSLVLNSFITSDNQLTLPGVTEGDHCYSVKDFCGTKTNNQISVKHYQDLIDLTYNCDNSVTLSVDSITAIYTWKNVADTVLGHSRRLTVPNPAAPTDFFVSIDIGPCTIKRSVTVFPTPIVPNVAIVGGQLQYLCTGDTIALTAISSTPSFLWNTGEGTAQIEIAQPGVYSVTVANSFGCTATEAVEIQQIPTFSPVVLGDHSVCPGVPNWLWVEGNFSNIFWSNGTAGNSILTAVPGVYSVSVTDPFGCVWEGQATVTAHIPPLPVILGDMLVCENQVTQLSLSQTFGKYFWSDGSSSPVMVAGRGEYSITVTDTNGCTGTDSVVVTEIPTIAVFLAGDTLICAGDPAQLTIRLENATDTVALRWNAPVLPSPTFLAQDSVLFFPASQNWLLAIDTASQPGYDCPFDLPDTVEILTNQPDVVAQVSQTYNGYDIPCYGMAEGSAKAQATSGFPPFQFRWSNQVQDSTISGLQAGWYIVTVTDFLGCRGMDSVEITQPEPLIPQIALEQPWCLGVDDGWAALSGWSGGAGAVKASLDGGYAAALPLRFERLSPGNYQLHLEDGNGCPFDTAFYFPEPLLLAVDLGQDLTLPLGDSARLMPYANFFPVDSFTWHPQTYLQDGELAPWCKPLETTLYRLQLWDEHGCPAEDALLVRVDKTPLLYAPNVFWPDGDGSNDYFTLFAKASSVRAIRSLRIFDRWGNQVFVNENFPPNEVQLGWDGNFRGKAMNPAVFAWWAEVEFIDGRVEVLKGDVTIVR